jgi:hypothetical protein
MVIVLVGFGARLKLPSGYILELTILGNDCGTAFRVTQIPGFVENTYNSFCFGHFHFFV